MIIDGALWPSIGAMMISLMSLVVAVSSGIRAKTRRLSEEAAKAERENALLKALKADRDRARHDLTAARNHLQEYACKVENIEAERDRYKSQLDALRLQSDEDDEAIGGLRDELNTARKQLQNQECTISNLRAEHTERLLAMREKLRSIRINAGVMLEEMPEEVRNA